MQLCFLAENMSCQQVVSQVNECSSTHVGIYFYKEGCAGSEKSTGEGVRERNWGLKPQKEKMEK